ncbi:hypothetical protein TPL01_22100 [Sulfuriferula plumbiphila]|uniref:Peptidase S24/S26A/S26B/S26C domain-containing protein n=1 Tax=Sulfuriferula plumbiphila TaxID=171865 RepID=A0A512L9E3_9PROT|nr:S24 family peptidase [Sulfuriferula plumbiphila]BBP03006.1 hypothetical protein SFPGR_04280 [Sulfuriferula plumbiphila]GEP31072.1 hypothetical protein TPL01_22100 [Sulfuriferula plumbiphila]
MNTGNQSSTKRRVQTRGEKPTPKIIELDLAPGFRDRLIEKMDKARVPKEARLAHLSAMTGRVHQTSRRWIDPIKPGLPDLESFALLCIGFHSDANWFLGLANTRYAMVREGARAEDRESATDSSAAAAWIAAIVRDLAYEVAGCEPMRMSGDDMDPIIHDGDMMFVDYGTQNVAGNGIYVVEYDGRVMVRTVESRIGEGLVLGCENRKYKECVVKDAVAAKRMGLKVMGKVRGRIGIAKFWGAN